MLREIPNQVPLSCIWIKTSHMRKGTQTLGKKYIYTNTQTKIDI